MGQSPNAERQADRLRVRAEKLQLTTDADEWTIAEMLRHYRDSRLEMLSPVTAGEYATPLDCFDR